MIFANSPHSVALTRSLALVMMFFLSATVLHAQEETEPFSWPDGKSIALSLTFDDARLSQVEGGTALLNEYGVKATFFVVPAQVQERLNGWKKAVADGHEIGNHTLTHPCSGNYAWSRNKALENYSLQAMRREMEACNKQVVQLLGIQPTLFAYPCGHTYVGRGAGTRSYVPLVSKLFFAARTYRDNISNDPSFCDLSQLTGIDMDGKDFADILPWLQRARQNNHWVILGGHEMGESGHHTTRFVILTALLEYERDPANVIWIAPMGTVAEYISEKRK